jgi:hypothetical protein
MKLVDLLLCSRAISRESRQNTVEVAKAVAFAGVGYCGVVRFGERVSRQNNGGEPSVALTPIACSDACRNTGSTKYQTRRRLCSSPLLMHNTRIFSL